MSRVLALTILVLGTALVVTGCGGPRVGVVDSRRILTESVLALSYQRQLNDQEKTMAADLRLLSDQLSPEDLEARRQSYLKDLAEMKRDLEKRLNERIRQEVAEIARRQRLRYVLVKDAAKVGGRDITQDVIDRLK